jgi:hypothetical protein
MIFNRDDWGFGELDLAEVTPPGASSRLQSTP